MTFSQINDNLIDAVVKNNVNEIRSLIKKVENLHEIKDKDNNNLLYIASSWGNLETVKYLVEEGKFLIDSKNNDYTALHTASYCSRIEVVKYLIEKGADLNIKGYGKTPLYFSAEKGHKEVIKLLLKSGVNPNINYDKNDFIKNEIKNIHKDLIDAVIKGDLSTVKNLIKVYDLHEIKNQDTNNLLYIASWKGNLEIVKCLVEEGKFPINSKSNSETALHIASYSGCTEVVKYLIKKGADTNLKDYKGRTPLDLSAEQGHKEVVKLLLKSGFNPNINYDKNDFIRNEIKNVHKDLIDAVTKGDLSTVKSLIKTYDLHKIKDEYSKDLLYLASFNNKLEVVKCLVEEGKFPIDSKSNVNSETALHAASYSGHIEVVTYLIEKGADIEAKDKNDKTPLYVAVKFGKLAIVKYLMEKGADVNVQEIDKLTPLHSATLNGNKEIVRILIENGADPNLKDDKGRAPLHSSNEIKNIYKDLINAVIKGDLSTVKNLIKICDLYKVKDESGRNLLHIASWKNKFEIIKCLVEEGKFPIDSKSNSNNETALHTASHYGCTEIVKYLIEKGADTNLKEDKDRIPIDFASCHEIKNLLQKNIHNTIATKPDHFNEDSNASIQSKDGDNNIVFDSELLDSDANLTQVHFLQMINPYLPQGNPLQISDNVPVHCFMIPVHYIGLNLPQENPLQINVPVHCFMMPVYCMGPKLNSHNASSSPISD